MKIKDGVVLKDRNAEVVIDYDKDEFNIRRFEDITPILKFNYEMRKDETQRNGFSKSRDLRWIGRIPQALFIEHYRKYPEARDPSGNYWAEFLKKDENEPFRTVPKILGGKTKYGSLGS
jgi:hypothetical protein